ncbi:hypothetical protein BD770DRAFT_334879 [Pilaira anomala]|nr:hypothetical protein BD770DRAFT_334879 [Pilaira anomala]
MLNHLALFKNSKNFPLLPLYDIECQVSPVSPRHLSIWPVIFELFDYFNQNDGFKLTQVPVHTLLTMPLRKLLLYPPTVASKTTLHWTLRHGNFSANLFLVFDSHQQRLRLKVLGKYTRYPVLCQRLYNEILTLRTIKLQPFVWDHIVNSPTTAATSHSDWKTHPLMKSMLSNNRWSPFDRQTFRQHYQLDAESIIIFDIKDIKEFWHVTMYPQARTIFFRAFSKCIPSKDLLLKFNMVNTSLCSFCGWTKDSLEHFLVSCLPRQVVLYQVLAHYYPH